VVKNLNPEWKWTPCPFCDTLVRMSCCRTLTVIWPTSARLSRPRWTGFELPFLANLNFEVVLDGVTAPRSAAVSSHRLDGLLLEALAQQYAVDFDYVRPHPAYKPRRRKDVLYLAVIQSDPPAQRGALPCEVEKSTDVVDRIGLGHFDDQAWRYVAWRGFLNI